MTHSAQIKIKIHHQRGFVLPIVIVLSMILLSSVALWYRGALVTGQLSSLLIERHALYEEINSLVPHLLKQLDGLSEDELSMEQFGFHQIWVQGDERWKIDRSEWKNEKIRFTFHPGDSKMEPLVLTVTYKRS